MRTEQDRISNAPFELFTIPVEGREKTFKAQALTMKEAMVWCKEAVAFDLKVQRHASSTSMTKYDDLSDLMEEAEELLRSYPRIENAKLINFDELTFEQALGAIDRLFKASDPFTRSQELQAEKVKLLGERMAVIEKTGMKLDLGRFIKQQELGELQPKL